MQTTHIILIALAAGLLIGAGVLSTRSHNKLEMFGYSPEVIEAFQKWQVTYGRKESDPDMVAYRLGIFNSNLQLINQLNAQDPEVTYAINQFADLTNEEFRATYLGLIPKTKMSENIHVNTGVNAASVDWRTKGAVTPVKNQGQCGSCWAFSTTGSLESVDFIQDGTLGDFSEQQLVDCSTSFGNQGCNGGLMDYAFQYVIANGITTEQAYPYVAVDQTCKTQGGAFKITKFTDVSSGNCSDLQNAVNQQPISIGVDAQSWQFYSGGVLKLCGKQLDHGVLAVGYDTSSNWIVKNSWGTSWGQQGYITLKKGNTCGICNTASYPTA